MIELVSCIISGVSLLVTLTTLYFAFKINKVTNDRRKQDVIFQINSKLKVEYENCKTDLDKLNDIYSAIKRIEKFERELRVLLLNFDFHIPVLKVEDHEYFCLKCEYFTKNFICQIKEDILLIKNDSFYDLWVERKNEEHLRLIKRFFQPIEMFYGFFWLNDLFVRPDDYSLFDEDNISREIIGSKNKMILIEIENCEKCIYDMEYHVDGDLLYKMDIENG